MQKLSFEQIKKLVHGVALTEEGDGNISFFRFTKEQQELYKSLSPTDFYIKTFATSGVSLEFETDSENLSLQVVVSRGSSRTFFTHSIFIDGEKFDELSGDIKNEENVPFEKSFTLKKGMKKIKILFPWSVCSRLVSLELDDGAKVIPTKKEFNLLMLGDSITQGYDAYAPENSYASQVVNYFNAETINKGIAGEFFLPSLVKEKEEFQPDLITVAYGTNDWKYKKREVFEKNCSTFFQNLRNSYPKVKIIALCPIGRIDLLKSPNFDKPHSYIGEYIKEVATKIDNMIVIDCAKFVPLDNEHLQTDGVHPIDKGFKEYGKNIIPEIEKAWKD